MLSSESWWSACHVSLSNSPPHRTLGSIGTSWHQPAFFVRFFGVGSAARLLGAFAGFAFSSPVLNAAAKGIHQVDHIRRTRCGLLLGRRQSSLLRPDEF